MALRRIVLTCIFLCQACPADTVGFGGSVLGFVFDPSNGLQPILGITGAATIGAPLNLSAGISNVVISRQQDYALAATTPDADWLRVTLGDSASIGPLGVPVSDAGLMALSPSGSAAAFHDKARSRIRVVTGLPGAAALAGEFDVSTFSGDLMSLAVSDAGDAVLAGFSGGVAALAADGTVRMLAAPQHATAAAFLSKSRDVAIADGAANAVYLARDVTGSSDPILLARDGGILQPAAVALSNDNQRAIVAISGGVATISLSDGAVTITACACAPSGLAGLSGNAVFRLTEPSGGPIWLFDGDAPQPRIVFVPPYQSSQDGPQ